MNVMGKDAVNSKRITNCNGIRKINVDKKTLEAKQKVKNKEDEKNLIKVPIQGNLVDRLMRNIVRRSTVDKAKGSVTLDPKPVIPKINSPIISERDFASEDQTDTVISTKVSARSSYGYNNYRKGRFKEYHNHVADTKEERMLKVYD